MTTPSTEGFWFLESDRTLMDRGILVEEDYSNSDLPSVKLWSLPQERQAVDGIVRYKARKLEYHFRNLDYLPGSTSLPVVSSRMRDVLENICSQSEIEFHPCEVRFPSGLVKKYWNFCPLIEKRFIDESQTNASWWTNDLAPFEKTIRRAKGVVLLQKGDAGNVFRLGEYASSIVISDYVREKILESRFLGFRCILPSEVELGIGS
jgi:hypothetical protein